MFSFVYIQVERNIYRAPISSLSLACLEFGCSWVVKVELLTGCWGWGGVEVCVVKLVGLGVSLKQPQTWGGRLTKTADGFEIQKSHQVETMGHNGLLGFTLGSHQNPGFLKGGA